MVYKQDLKKIGRGKIRVNGKKSNFSQDNLKNLN